MGLGVVVGSWKEHTEYMNNTETTTTPVTDLKVGDRFVAPNGVVHTATTVERINERLVYVAWRTPKQWPSWNYRSDATVEVVR